MTSHYGTGHRPRGDSPHPGEDQYEIEFDQTLTAIERFERYHDRNPPIYRLLTELAKVRITQFVAESVEGERNSQLFWAACRAHENGLDPASLLAAAESVGLRTMAARTTIRSAANAAPRARKQAC